MKPSNTQRTGEKTVSLNRLAFHQYHISDIFEAGMALRGTEVKSIRAGRVNLKEGYGAVKGGKCGCSTVISVPMSRETA